MHLNATLSWELPDQEIPLSLFGEHNGLLALPLSRKGMDDPIECPVRAVFSSQCMFTGPIQLILTTVSLTMNGYSPVKVRLNSRAFRVISRGLRGSHLNSFQCSGETLCHLMWEIEGCLGWAEAKRRWG